MRLSFSPYYFSVVVAAAAAGPWKAFSLDAKNGEIPSSYRRSLEKSSKKTGPPSPPPSPSPTVNPIFTVDCTDGGISDHTASLYDEPYPTDRNNDGGMIYATVVDTGITKLVPKGNDQLVYEIKGTAPRACMDDMVNHCAEMCDSASKCTAFEAYIFKPESVCAGNELNPFEELGGILFYCTLYNSTVPNLPLKVIRGKYEDNIEGRVFALKTAQVDQPLAVYTSSDAWEVRDPAFINLDSQWVQPALACIATKSYTALPDVDIVPDCTNCLFTTLNTIYKPGSSCEESANFICERSGLNGVGLNTCARECFFDVGGPNDEICQNTVRVAFLAISGSNAFSCVMSDVYDAEKGYILANYTCPFMQLPLGSPYPYFPPKVQGQPTLAPTGTYNPTVTLDPTTTYSPTYGPTSSVD